MMTGGSPVHQNAGQKRKELLSVTGQGKTRKIQEETTIEKINNGRIVK